MHKHQKNKKEKERIEDERAQLEEEEYRRRHHGHRRKHHSHDRPHSHDGRYGRESPKPKPILKPTTMPAAQPMYQAPPFQAPPQYDAHPNPPQQRPQDVKYGWTDDTPAPGVPPPPQQQQTFPVTGWPAHWEQSQRPASSTHLAHQVTYQRSKS